MRSPEHTIDVVIRTFNEEKKLRRLLTFLSQNREVHLNQHIVVVDNGSSDTTALLAKQFSAQCVYLPQKDFNYPKSSNMGVSAGSSPFVALIGAHALPLYPDWALASLSHFADHNVAGVYGPVIPFPDSPILEKLVSFPKFWVARMQGSQTKITAHAGIMGATNCIVRRDLWKQHPFDEHYAAGAEDYEWAIWALRRGYHFIYEPRFTVQHSHYLSPKQMLAQYRHWKSLINQPRPFDPSELSFRSDIKRDNRSTD